MNIPLHQHTLCIAKCEMEQFELKKGGLISFLNNLIKEIDMQVLIDPQVQLGPFGYTGIAGIVTSHIAFHYFYESKTLQLDIYSCKKYDVLKAIKYVDLFWHIVDAEITTIERDKTVKIKIFEYNSKLGKLSRVNRETN